jgi:hypothetical protein
MHAISKMMISGTAAMAIKRRKQASARRPLLGLDDVKLAAELPILWLAALTIPERRWKTLCFRLESIKARLNLFDPTRVANTAGNVIGARQLRFDARGFALESAAGRSEHHLQILRCRSAGGWKAIPQLHGASRLDAALAGGRGAVLWVAHFCFNALATKKALRLAGYRVWHLSRPEHGFSKSILGIAVLNPIRVGAELEYLAGRIVFDRDKPATATIAAQRLLRNNGILSITAGAWEGQRLAESDLLGGKLELAVGAPGLARLTGAALLPVFTVRGAGESTIKVIIEKPLSIPAEGTMDEALQAATQQFADLLESYVRRYPTEWRDWKNLRLPISRTAG